jgi:anti-sigma regulatory factor (Ser/Thr protein kinase)
MKCPEVSCLVPPVTSAVSDARRVLKDHCERLGCGEVLDTLILLASELVANAILHADGQIRLTVRNAGRRVMVLVDDETSALPSPRARVDGWEERGRGLFLVDALADSWGTEHTAIGKTVWFTLSY